MVHFHLQPPSYWDGRRTFNFHFLFFCHPTLQSIQIGNNDTPENVLREMCANHCSVEVSCDAYYIEPKNGANCHLVDERKHPNINRTAGHGWSTSKVKLNPVQFVCPCQWFGQLDFLLRCITSRNMDRQRHPIFLCRIFCKFHVTTTSSLCPKVNVMLSHLKLKRFMNVQLQLRITRERYLWYRMPNVARRIGSFNVSSIKERPSPTFWARNSSIRCSQKLLICQL